VIVDTSAMVAIVRDEPDGVAFMERIERAALAGEAVRISAGTLVELFVVIDRFKDARASQMLDALLVELKLEVFPVDAALAAIARTGSRRFGKGFSPARLNFGDCFAYALAKQTGEPLLFKGNDFSETDVVSAV